MNAELEIKNIKRQLCCIKSTLFFDNFAAFPPVGKVNTIYVDKTLAVSYYWNDTSYIQFSGGAVSSNIITQGDTLVEVLDTGVGVINFIVDGINVGNVEVIAGTPKWTLEGILDPTVYQGKSLTIAQRNALTPLTGYLVYIVDGSIKEYQYYDGAAWKSLPITINDTLLSTSTTEALSANQGKVLQDGKEPKVDSSGFSATGSENSIGINTTDDTAQKIFDKVEAFNAVSDNIYTANGTLTGDRTVDADSNFLKTQNLSEYEVKGNLIPTISDFKVTTSGGVLSSEVTNLLTGEKASVDVLSSGSEEIVNISVTTNAGAEQNTVSAKSSGVELLFTDVSDLKIGSTTDAPTSGTLGQVITSQGPGIPPKWETSAAGLSSVPLTYGRVNASSNLANIAYSSTGNGTAVNFNATQYQSGMSFSGTNGIVPSVPGRYRVEWMLSASGTQLGFNADAVVVQNDSALATVFMNIDIDTSRANVITQSVDLDLVAGQAVTLRYKPTSADSVAFDKGSYFQLTQLPTAVAPVVNTVAEYGEQVLGSSVLISNTSTNSGNATDIMSFTIPSAGTWDIDYTIRGVKNETNADNVVRMVAIITDNSNSLIANSELMVGGQRGGSTSGLANDLQASGAMRLRVTTTGATTYKVRGFNDGSSSIFTWSAVSDGNGKTKVSWNKIAGQLPSTGTTVDYIEVGSGAGLNIPTLGGANTALLWGAVKSGNIPYNAATGQFTLTAGKTYKLEAETAQGASYVFWWNATTNATLNTNTAGSNTTYSGEARTIFTPTVTTLVELRGGSSSYNAGNGDTTLSTKANIVQLGSSNIIVPGTDGIWSNYTPTFLTQSGGTKANSTYDLATYTTVGKTITLNYRWQSAGTGGGTSGTGTGRWSLPAGVTFDLTKIVADGTTGGVGQLVGSVIGNGNVTYGATPTSYPTIVYAFDANSFGFGANLVNTNLHRMGGITDFSNAQLGVAATNGLSFSLTAPII